MKHISTGLCTPKAKSGTAKEPASAPFGVNLAETQKNPLFEATPKNFGITTILKQRSRVPPSIAQFSHTLDKNTATQLFKLLNKYRPESKVEKKASLEATAETKKPLFINQTRCVLPAFCRKMGAPYVIVKGKIRLGTVVHKKTAAVVALQDVKSEGQRELATLVSAQSQLCDGQRCLWGRGLRGNKSTQKLRKRAKAAGQNANAANIGREQCFRIILCL
ncbi:hypothetical protein BT96DRAFT_958166 [Gymnopus androsaceus JB14]|uniref:60S ribosomal protein L8 n=1 Tax=Gymnopus androsaceus JB14 TaxID=1447944 RepID=A0A6A4HHD7_9AGAR|nr:hypothetical protein BT96DRAFT_958166 [Gymnopus androsaceus JB14]